MRITNRMMTNSTLSNINKNKTALSKLGDQYTSGKKIQKPSDDPITAVRSLKLRKTLSEIDQYLEKNIPDAYNWMEYTESALTNINSIYTSINTYCNQGSNDTLSTTDRQSVVANLQQLASEIYQQGNSTYAGRYIFTGYKTDTSLTFTEDTTNLDYQITQNFNGKDINIVSQVIGGLSMDDYDATAASSQTFAAPQLVDTYRIQLAYNSLADLGANFAINSKDADGNTVSIFDSSDFVSYSASDSSAYDVSDGKSHYIVETGELILTKDDYEKLTATGDFSVTYEKKSFADGDLRPEHYFDCKMTNATTGAVSEYTFASQQIQYEINAGQKLTVNTQASDAITSDIARKVDEIARAAQAVDDLEKNIAEVEKLLTDGNISDTQKGSLNALKEQLETQLTLQNSVLQKAFASGLTTTEKQESIVNVAVSDLGSRYVRLQLTESRLENQQTEVTDLLSTNEDADLAEVIVNYSSQETIYNASLNVASKLLQSSLLDFI